MTIKPDKVFRLLQLHERLSKGEPIIKNIVMFEISINNKTFQRDIDSLRQYCSEYDGAELAYDRKSDCYRLKSRADCLTKEEIFAVCKVLFESRAFNKIGQAFSVPYTDRFSETEFRKRVQFMYAGKLRTICFLYRGLLEVVLDCLPTTWVECKTDEGTIIRAEVYGNGADMWLRSQGEIVEVIR